MWALGHIEVTADAAALDVGCGGGRTVDRLAKMAVDGWVVGLDYSEDSVTRVQTKEHEPHPQLPGGDLPRTGVVDSVP